MAFDVGWRVLTILLTFLFLTTLSSQTVTNSKRYIYVSEDESHLKRRSAVFEAHNDAEISESASSGESLLELLRDKRAVSADLNVTKVIT